MIRVGSLVMLTGTARIGVVIAAAPFGWRVRTARGEVMREASGLLVVRP